MKLSSLKQQIEELDAKATKGPWKSVVNHAPYKVVVIDEEEYYTTLELKPDDGDFIALSRTALPELLRRLLVAETAVGKALQHLGCDPCQLTEALATIRGEEE